MVIDSHAQPKGRAASQPRPPLPIFSERAERRAQCDLERPISAKIQAAAFGIDADLECVSVQRAVCKALPGRSSVRWRDGAAKAATMGIGDSRGSGRKVRRPNPTSASTQMTSRTERGGDAATHAPMATARLKVRDPVLGRPTPTRAATCRFGGVGLPMPKAQV